MFMGHGYYQGMEATYSKRIDELMAENKRLREVLEKIEVDCANCNTCGADEIAKAALSEKGE